MGIPHGTELLRRSWQPTVGCLDLSQGPHLLVRGATPEFSFLLDPQQLSLQFAPSRGLGVDLQIPKPQGLQMPSSWRSPATANIRYPESRLSGTQQLTITPLTKLLSTVAYERDTPHEEEVPGLEPDARCFPAAPGPGTCLCGIMGESGAPAEFSMLVLMFRNSNHSFFVVL